MVQCNSQILLDINFKRHSDDLSRNNFMYQYHDPKIEYVCIYVNITKNNC